MLRGETEAIRIEDPKFEKVDLVVTLPSRREFHQMKRHHPSGKWSLAELKRDGLLVAIGNHLECADSLFVLRSGSDAPELRSLCEAAGDAGSLGEFERHFLKSEQRAQAFDMLRRLWACDSSTAMGRLRRIEVRNIGERELEQKVQWGVQALFLADPNVVEAELRKIVEDSVHATIDRDGLVQRLEERGHGLRKLCDPHDALNAVGSATGRYLTDVRSRLIQRRLVKRAATQDILCRIEGPATETVVTGRAGSGKTGCVVHVADELRERGLPVLAFRLDRIPSSASLPAQLGEHLGLEESPVLVLAAAAQHVDRPAVLIIDQLDTVSTMSGRDSDKFFLVERLLQEAGVRSKSATPVHVVVVCREFDWKNDARLRGLLPDSEGRIVITRFAVEEVKKILLDCSVDPTSLDLRQLELLRLPQNLSLFLNGGFDGTGHPGFATEKELFDRYWNEKRTVLAEHSSDQWMDAMEILCEEMTAARELSIPKEKLDSSSPDYLRQMASEGVLTFDGHRYGFGHESFFDYCFARCFVNGQESLLSFLKASEQHLFRRAQVRQVLAYLRDADRQGYLAGVRELLADDDIRTHIKHLVFALLASVADPTEEEWNIWQTWITATLDDIAAGSEDPSGFSAMAWRHFFGSRSWFGFVTGRGLVEEWLSSDSDPLVEKTIGYVSLHQRHFPGRVGALLEPYEKGDGEWPTRLRTVMKRATLDADRGFFELFLRLIKSGTLDEFGEGRDALVAFWDMGTEHPEWIPEVLACTLLRRLEVVLTSDVEFRGERFLGYSRSAEELFNKAAECAPATFVKHALPAVLVVSDSTVDPGLTAGARPRQDLVWRTLIKTRYPDVEDACLSALAAALGTLAREGSEDLGDMVSELRRRDTHIANHLLLALYGGNAARYADEAASMFCAEPWRFECGFNGNRRWCAGELIRRVAPHCTLENREKLEYTILNHLSPSEREEWGAEWRGYARFQLLSSFPEELRSAQANAHFEEFEDRFEKPPEEPAAPTVESVESPIPRAIAKRQSNEEWLRAIEKHNDDRIDRSGGKLTGGAPQLAQVLEAEAKEDPERFALLSLEFSADTNVAYVKRTLAALEKAPVATALKVRVCRKAFSEFQSGCGKEIADVLGCAEDSLPDEAIEMLHDVMTRHHDPPSGLGIDTNREPGDSSRDLERQGINTTRGRAAFAIHKLILADPSYIVRFRPTLEEMIRDPSAAVLSWSAAVIGAVASHDPELGISLFLAADLFDDRLLSTTHVQRFLRWGLHNHFVELRPFFERMLRSDEPEVCELGARLVSVAVLLGHEDAEDLAEEARSGGSNHRRGVARVAAANIAVLDCRVWAEERLVDYFDDEDSDVRWKAASCFGKLKDEPLDQYEDMILAFCDSKAFQSAAFRLLKALEGSVRRLPGMTCDVCWRVLDSSLSEPDGKTLLAGARFNLEQLVFRTYRQHQDNDWGKRALDLIDRLCLESFSDVGSRFEEFDR